MQKDWKNCQQKFEIFGCSKFIPVFLGKIVGKNLEQPFLVVPNLYQSFWKKLLEKNLEQPFLAIPNLYQSLWKKLSEKIWNGHFWPFQGFSGNFSVHITLIEYNGLQSNEICKFVHFWIFIVKFKQIPTYPFYTA